MKGRNVGFLRGVKDPLGLSGNEFKVIPVPMALCVSLAKSETLKGMRRVGSAIYLMVFKDVLSCSLRNMPSKEALSLEPREVQSTSQNKYFGQDIR